MHNMAKNTTSECIVHAILLTKIPQICILIFQVFVVSLTNFFIRNSMPDHDQ